MAYVNINESKILMELSQLHQEINVIKNILIEEGELTEETKERLKKARKTEEKKYITVEAL